MAYPMGCFMAAIISSQNASRHIREEEEKKSKSRELLEKFGEPKYYGECKHDGFGHKYKASQDASGLYWEKIW